jgi:hypothetical protein
MVNIQWINYQQPKVAKLLPNYGADPLFIHRPKAITAGITVGILYQFPLQGKQIENNRRQAIMK